MALARNDDKDLLAVWQRAQEEGDDGLRRRVERVVQQGLEAEISQFLRASPYERTSERRGYRKGYKPRLLKTRVGTLELVVPKDREGQFQTELFERYQRWEKALWLALVQMDGEGVSPRKVRQITEAWCGLEISKSQVSSLAKNLDEEVEAGRQRRLTQTYPSLVIDARYERVRRHGEVIPQGVLRVVGISPEGYREVLGVWLADSENETRGAEVFVELKERGLAGVRLVVSDDHRALVRALARYFQGAVWPRCQVHFVRNVLPAVSLKDRREVFELLKEIPLARRRVRARQALEAAAHQLRAKYPRVAQLFEEQGEEILAVYQLPEAHRKRMKSTHLLERLSQEIKRRTRVVRIFPDEAACLRLVCALAMETHGEWMERAYLKMDETAVSEDERIEVA